MNQRGFSFKKCMVGLVLAIAMVIQTPVSGFAADVCTQSNVVQAEGKVSKTRVNNVNTYYLGIPENVRQYLEDKGWTFICSAQSFGKRYGYTGSILALTVYKDKVIYIDNRKKAESAIVHEVGHAIDYSYGFTSNSQAFNDIFAVEHNNVSSFWITHHSNTDTAVEYFAEAFQIMCSSQKIYRLTVRRPTSISKTLFPDLDLKQPKTKQKKNTHGTHF